MHHHVWLVSWDKILPTFDLHGLKPQSPNPSSLEAGVIGIVLVLGYIRNFLFVCLRQVLLPQPPSC
jgi:hypothetical protein